MDVAALAQILRLDVERLVALTPQLPRELRGQARGLALRAWQGLEAETQDGAALLSVLNDMHGLLAPTDAGRTTMTVWQMRVAKPEPERMRRTLVADRVAQWQARFDRRWQVRLAVSAARLQWLESRVAERAPTQVATVRQPEVAQGRDSLELLHKRGRTRFS